MPTPHHVDQFSDHSKITLEIKSGKSESSNVFENSKPVNSLRGEEEVILEIGN